MKIVVTGGSGRFGQVLQNFKTKHRILFPSKKTKCNYRKLLILVAYCQVPLFLNALILTPGFLLLAFITYAWYNISLIIGLKIFLNYDSYIKTTFVSLAPQIMFFLFIFSSFQKNTIAFS